MFYAVHAQTAGEHENQHNKNRGDDLISFSYKTVVITLKESYLAFRRNRWKTLATRSIRKMTNPDRKKAGMIVSRSTIPSKETRKRIVALDLLIPGL